MDKVQIAVDIFNQGMNCAQSTFLPFAEQGGLDRGEALLVASCFGGGMRCWEVCGAVTGALMAIGLACGYTSMENPAGKTRANALAVLFEKEFREKNHSILCRELLGYNIADPDELKQIQSEGLFDAVCPVLVGDAVVIAEQIITEANSSRR